MKPVLVLLAVAAVGVIAGASLIARWAVGVAVIVDSAGVAVLALTLDVPDQPKALSLPDVVERYRRSA